MFSYDILIRKTCININISQHTIISILVLESTECFARLRLKKKKKCNPSGLINMWKREDCVLSAEMTSEIAYIMHRCGPQPMGYTFNGLLLPRGIISHTVGEKKFTHTRKDKVLSAWLWSWMETRVCGVRVRIVKVVIRDQYADGWIFQWPWVSLFLPL